MSSHLLTRLILAVALALTTAAGLFADPAPSPAFHNLTLEEACKMAAAENKVVFVDFYATWCGPCKMLDATTWRDPSVMILLREKAVAIKLDAEKHKDLAANYQVDGYPTLFVLTADGWVRERIDGAPDAVHFIPLFNAALTGWPHLERARATLARTPEKENAVHVMARYRLGVALRYAGQSEAALPELLWAFDEGMPRYRDLGGDRSGALLDHLRRMSTYYGPAHTALVDRRDRAKARFLAEADMPAMNDFIALSRALGEETQTAAILNELPEGDPRRIRLGYPLFDEFYQLKSYQNALVSRPYTQIKGMWAHMIQADQAAESAGKLTEGQQRRRKANVGWLAKHLEVLAGAGDLEHARELLATALAFDSSHYARTRYLAALHHVGHPELLPE